MKHWFLGDLDVCGAIPDSRICLECRSDILSSFANKEIPALDAKAIITSMSLGCKNLDEAFWVQFMIKCGCCFSYISAANS